jgi:hypothetical protein
MADERDSNISVSAGGVTAKYSGKQMAEVISLILLLVVAGFGLLLYTHSSESRAAEEKVVSQMRALEAKQQQTTEAVNANTIAIKELIYVIALPQDRRSELQLDMPDSLRDRVRRR